MRLLGIDPGTARLGFGVVERQGTRLAAIAFGVLRTGPEEPAERRLLRLAEGIEELLAQHRPDGLAVEQIFSHARLRSALSVGQARGVALLLAARAGLPVHEYTPLQVKLAVAGYGQAHKVQVQGMVARLLALPAAPRPDDAADALAVAICGLHSEGSRRRWLLERPARGGGAS